MRWFLFSLLQILSIFLKCDAQTTSQENVLNDSIKQKLEIYYPTAFVLPYAQGKEKYQVMFTHNYDDAHNSGEKNKHHSHLVAFNLKMTGDSITKLWRMEDYISDLVDNPGNLETEIYWLQQYCSTTDIDKDGVVEPVVCYASEGNNGIDDGRLKIIMWYKGEKIGVRHQNGVLDFQRNTKVDKKFYKLPSAIREHVYALMSDIEKNNKAIFPYGWKDKMKKGVGEIRE